MFGIMAFNKTPTKLILSASIGVVALIVLMMFASPFPVGNLTGEQSVSEVKSVQAPEIFDVKPMTETITPTEFSLTTESKVATMTERPANNGDTAQFLIPTVRDAFAITPTTNSVTAKEWTVPTASAGIVSTAFNSNTGDLWFPEPNLGRIAKLNPSTNMVTEWTMPTGVPVSFPVAVDPSTGYVYFPESQTQGFNKLARLDPSTGGIIEWSLQDSNPGTPRDIYNRVEFDPATGNLWLSNVNGGTADNTISRLNPTTNVQTRWTIIAVNGGNNLFAQPKIDTSGNVWFTQVNTNTVNRLNPSTNQHTTWPIPQPGSVPVFVAIDPTNVNNVYFAESSGNRIGRLVVNTNQITQWIVPTSGSGPDTIISDSQGTIYFRELNSNKIGRLVASSNTITEWTVPTAGSRAGWFSADGSDNIYFSEEANGVKVGRLS